MRFDEQCTFIAAVNHPYVTRSYIKLSLYVGHRNRIITTLAAELIETSRSTLAYLRYDTIVSGYVEKVETLPAGGSKSDWRRGYFWSSPPTRRSSFPADLFSIHAPDGNGLLEELFAFAKQNGHTASIHGDIYEYQTRRRTVPFLYTRLYIQPESLMIHLAPAGVKFGERISVEQFF